MTKSRRWSLPLVTKSSSMSLLAACLVTLAFSADVFAATPLPVNIYQSMESGNTGDLLSSTIMDASSYGNQAWQWLGTNQAMWVSNNNVTDLPGPVSVSGTIYNGTGGTRSWMFNDNLEYNAVCCTFTNPLSNPGVTAACYFTPGLTHVIYHEDDTIRLVANDGIGWGVLETGINGDGTLYFNSHSCDYHGITTRGPQITGVVAGHTYWMNLHFDIGGLCSAAVFDPSNGFAQVGSVSTCLSHPGSVIKEADFGRGDNVGNDNLTSQSYFDKILVNYTNGLFPLIPGATDTTPPTAPPAVYDGTVTGVETSTTGSLVALSANWTAGSDPQSGIFGYRFAIGTTAGGTDVVPWTYVGNVTTVTQQYLSLTVGKTYYFSVKSVNGAGLLSAATVSPGQTVVSDSTPPSAPSAVYNTQYGPLPSISTTTSLTELCAVLERQHRSRGRNRLLPVCNRHNARWNGHHQLDHGL